MSDTTQRGREAARLRVAGARAVPNPTEFFDAANAQVIETQRGARANLALRASRSLGNSPYARELARLGRSK